MTLIHAVCTLALVATVAAPQGAPATAAPTPAASAAPSWVTRAGPYVVLQHASAYINPTIGQHMRKGEVQMVHLAVAMYNLQPLTLRQTGWSYAAGQKPYPSLTSWPPPASIAMTSGANCDRRAQEHLSWWGWQLTVNACLLSDLLGILNAGGGAPAGAAALVPVLAVACTPCAPQAGTVAAFLSQHGADLQAVAAQCRGHGVVLNETWLATTPWIAKAC